MRSDRFNIRFTTLLVMTSELKLQNNFLVNINKVARNKISSKSHTQIDYKIILNGGIKNIFCGRAYVPKVLLGGRWNETIFAASAFQTYHTNIWLIENL